MKTGANLTKNPNDYWIKPCSLGGFYIACNARFTRWSPSWKNYFGFCSNEIEVYYEEDRIDEYFDDGTDYPFRTMVFDSEEKAKDYIKELCS